MDRNKMISEIVTMMTETVKMISNLVRDGLKSINTEQKICLTGMAIGMFMTVYAFSIDKYKMYVWISGYALAMLCSICYGLFKYFPILRRSKRLSANVASLQESRRSRHRESHKRLLVNM